MYIETVPNRNSPPAILLRRCWRESGRVRKQTLANLTKWPAAVVEAMRRALAGQRLAAIDEVFAIERSIPHGHVEAVLGMVRRLGLDELIGAKRSRQRNLVVAMIVERLIHPCSKLATTRLWKDTTLAGELGVGDAEVGELYEALGWLYQRQGKIEKALAARHLSQDALVLYDLTSSYFEGHTCPLLQYGHSRDHRRDRPQIVYGVMTDEQGRPIGVEVYAGNTADPATVAGQVEKLRRRFGLKRAVLVGDRGMLTQARIDAIKEHPGLGWISALRNGAIRKLVNQGTIQLSLFDRQNLAEIASPDFPGERLVVCLNPLLRDERRRKREQLLAASQAALDKIAAQVRRNKRAPMPIKDIAKKVEKALGSRKMEKHFDLTIEEGRFEWARREEAIAQEAALDGFYVIRTSEPAQRFSPEQTVRHYKALARVERAFRTLKGIDLRVRPIHHRLEDNVRAHVFLCVLAYYVEWHMRQALAPLIFDDEELDQRRPRRDPIAPAQASASARRKKAVRLTPDGFEVHSFETLLAHLATRCKNRCRPRNAPAAEPVHVLTDPTPLQTRALQLLEMYPARGTQNLP